MGALKGVVGLVDERLDQGRHRVCCCSICRLQNDRWGSSLAHVGTFIKTFTRRRW